jgi:hypothetical protein
MLPAAFGLSLVMIGAIRTHLHNHDPFSDPLEALHLLMLLACILLIRQFRGRVGAPTGEGDVHFVGSILPEIDGSFDVADQSGTPFFRNINRLHPFSCRDPPQGVMVSKGRIFFHFKAVTHYPAGNK